MLGFLFILTLLVGKHCGMDVNHSFPTDDNEFREQHSILYEGNPSSSSNMGEEGYYQTHGVSDRLAQCSDENERCSICLDEMSITPKLSELSQCNHVFHHKCIVKWWKIKPECPLCQRKFINIHLSQFSKEAFFGAMKLKDFFQLIASSAFRYEFFEGKLLVAQGEPILRNSTFEQVIRSKAFFEALQSDAFFVLIGSQDFVSWLHKDPEMGLFKLFKSSDPLSLDLSLKFFQSITSKAQATGLGEKRKDYGRHSAAAFLEAINSDDFIRALESNPAFQEIKEMYFFDAIRTKWFIKLIRSDQFSKAMKSIWRVEKQEFGSSFHRFFMKLWSREAASPRTIISRLIQEQYRE